MGAALHARPGSVAARCRGRGRRPPARPVDHRDRRHRARPGRRPGRRGPTAARIAAAGRTARRTGRGGQDPHVACRRRRLAAHRTAGARADRLAGSRAGALRRGTGPRREHRQVAPRNRPRTLGACPTVRSCSSTKPRWCPRTTLVDLVEQARRAGGKVLHGRRPGPARRDPHRWCLRPARRAARRQPPARDPPLHRTLGTPRQPAAASPRPRSPRRVRDAGTHPRRPTGRRRDRAVRRLADRRPGRRRARAGAGRC